MENENINLIDTNPQKQPKKVSKLLIYPLVIIVVLFVVLTRNVLLSEDGIFKYIITNFTQFTPENEDKVLSGEEDDRMNILLMGIGGLNHDGGTLTDTIMVASIKPSTKQTALISVPRDLYVELPDYGKRKINSAYALTERDAPGSGGLVASKVVSETLGIPIHYYVTVDFAGFKDLVDNLGGLDVYVPQGFVDYQYPDENYEYQTIRFEKGWTVMDGDQALKFARSRHGLCLERCAYTEGSDFARSKRQQIILKSFKDEVLSAKTLTRPKDVLALYNAYRANIDTNIEVWELFKFKDLAREINNDEITHLVLDDSPQGFLYAANINGAYVLLPKNNDFADIQNAVANIFTSEEVIDNVISIAPTSEPEITRIEIQNGTTINGLASKFAETFEDEGFYITKIGNAQEQDIAETIIYDLTDGNHEKELQLLQKKLNNAKIALSVPESLFNDNPAISAGEEKKDSNADFLIILGEDQDSE